MGLSNINYPVSDIAAAKALFTELLGVEPHTDTEYYVGYNVDGLEVALNPGGAQQGLTGASPFWAVPDVDAALARLEAAGASVTQPPMQVAPGVTLAALTDADGNTIGIITG